MNEPRSRNSLELAYQQLGVSPSASPSQIKRAYRAAAKTWHPDKWPKGSDDQKAASEKMRLLNSSYDLIKSAPLRSQANNHKSHGTTQSSSATVSRLHLSMHLLANSPLVSLLAVSGAGILLLLALKFDANLVLQQFFSISDIRSYRHIVNMPGDTRYAYFPQRLLLDSQKMVLYHEVGLIEPTMISIYCLPGQTPDSSISTASIIRSTKDMTDLRAFLLVDGIERVARAVYRVENDADSICVAYKDPAGKPVISYECYATSKSYAWALSYVREIGHEPTGAEILELCAAKATIYPQIKKQLAEVLIMQQ